MQQSQHGTNIAPALIWNIYGISSHIKPIRDIQFTPGTLNIDFGRPIERGPIKNIIEMPIVKIPPLQEPPNRLYIEYDSPTVQTSIDLPTNRKIIKKQAVRLIVIRRKKMKKHKRKKLRKRMKFVWAKIRLRRNQKREKEFQTELISKVKAAEAFDAKDYVKERLDILNKEWIPRTYRGEILPSDVIKKFLEEKKAKKDAKRNKFRLTL